MTLVDKLPPLSYPVTVNFSRPWFTPTAYLISLLALGVLVPLNIALTGYETVTIQSNDFNAVPRHWFNRFVSPPKPGSLCDSQVLGLGDQVSTNYTIFTWTIETIGLSNGISFSAGIPYTGASLDSCDVSEIDILVNNSTEPTISVAARVNCANPPLVMSTFFMWSDVIEVLATGPGPDFVKDIGSGVPPAFGFLPMSTVEPVGSGFWNWMRVEIFTPALGNVLQDVTNKSISAGDDLLDQLWIALPGGPLGAWSSSFCPNTPRRVDTTNCTELQPFPLEDAWVMTTLNGSDEWRVSGWGPGAGVYGDSEGALHVQELAQAMRAAARMDIGNNWMENNWLLAPHPSLSPDDTLEHLPTFDLNSSSIFSATFNAVYQCRTTQLKSGGSLFISVLVATLSIFSSIWGAFMLVAAMLEKRTQNVGRSAGGAGVRKYDAPSLELENLMK